ncbi:MAG: hypothetical protein JKY92_03365 [Magnetovibrio sp.]|nr:hypothetical protein [Magnetovibrio sp.]
MSGLRYTQDFKRDANVQVTDRGDSVKGVATKLGIRPKSLYDCSQNPLQGFGKRAKAWKA